MKRIYTILPAVLLTLLLAGMPTQKSQAQIGEIVAAVIKAMDIQVQKLQNHIIDLQNAQKKVENWLHQTKLAEISDWVQKQKDLYAEYFDELWKVKSVITYFKEITDIVNAQKELLADYKQVFSQLQQDKHFSPDELAYCNNVFTAIIDASLKNVDEIVLLLKSYTVQMPDAERLKIMQQAATAIRQNITDLRSFSRQTIMLSVQRSRDEGEMNVVRQLYGITN